MGKGVFGRSGRSARQGRVNRNPLRRVVARVTRPVSCGEIAAGLPGEQLECGHIVPVKTDFVGETNAVRRRCRECGRLAPGDSAKAGG